MLENTPNTSVTGQNTMLDHLEKRRTPYRGRHRRPTYQGRRRRDVEPVTSVTSYRGRRRAEGDFR